MEIERTTLIQTTFAQIDRLVQPTSLAQVGGFRPPDRFVTSSFSGHFVGLPDEDWPIYAGLPMIPLIQIRIDELPHVPVQLSQVAVLTVFMAADMLPQPDALNGQGWLLRTYPSSEQLKLLPQPTAAIPIKAFPVR
ncbi:MAG: hypothetical protein AAGF95_14535 [Chloroflexota bacterium]